MNAGSERKNGCWSLGQRKGKKKVVGKEEAETKNDLLRDEKREEKWKRQTVKRRREWLVVEEGLALFLDSLKIMRRVGYPGVAARLQG